MRTPTALWLVFLTSAVAIAGCTSGSPSTQSTDPVDDADFDPLQLQASETKGILRGVVIDDAIRPIAGVNVTAVGGANVNVTMATKEDGLFGFDDLDPGTYFITAAKPGYATIQASKDVVAGDNDPDPVKILMKVDATTGPYIQPYHLDGYITCSVRPMFLGLQCGVGGADVVNADYDLAKVPDWIQSEMRWESTQAAGDELSLAVRCLSNSPRCPDGQLTIARSEGHSPRITMINRTTAELWALGAPDGDPLQLSIFAFGRSDLDVYDEETIDGAQEPVTGKPCLDWMGTLFPAGTCIRMTGPGFIVNQKVDVYTHVFYGFTPREGWTFGIDGEHPLPP